MTDNQQVNLNKKGLVYISLGFMLSLFSSCDKQELPVPAHEAGDVITGSVSMKSDYRYQLFFDLEKKIVIKQNLKTDWDLAFEANGNHVILNTAKAMLAVNTQKVEFSAVPSTEGLSFIWDETSGNLDSTAISDWEGKKNVYVIDRGYDESGLHLGYKKIIFQLVDNTGYSISFANLDGTDSVSYQIPKDDRYNFTFFSLEGEGSIEYIEPPKEDWDIEFTQYTNIFYDQDPPLPYLVTGVSINREKVEVSKVFDKTFEEITLSDASDYVFSSSINVIGYDWKFYSFSVGKYTVDSKQNYLIRSSKGKYYKLHFIDFYDTFGEKGTPQFEFQEL